MTGRCEHPAARRVVRAGRAGAAAAAALAALLACALLLAACGAEDASAPPKAADLAAVKRLSAPQADAIDKVYVAALRFERRGGAAKRRTRAASDAALAPLLGACGKLDGNDALLRELFGSCAAEGSFVRYTGDIPRCSNADVCSEAFMTLRAALKRMVAAEHRSDRAVAATRLAPACKQVLTTPASAYAGLRRLDNVIERIVRALESQTRRDARRARNAARTFRTPPARSTRRQRALFRANCR